MTLGLEAVGVDVASVVVDAFLAVEAAVAVLVVVFFGVELLSVVFVVVAMLSCLTVKVNDNVN